MHCHEFVDAEIFDYYTAKHSTVTSTENTTPLLTNHKRVRNCCPVTSEGQSSHEAASHFRDSPRASSTMSTASSLTLLQQQRSTMRQARAIEMPEERSRGARLLSRRVSPFPSTHMCVEGNGLTLPYV